MRGIIQRSSVYRLNALYAPKAITAVNIVNVPTNAAAATVTATTANNDERTPLLRSYKRGEKPHLRYDGSSGRDNNAISSSVNNNNNSNEYVADIGESNGEFNAPRPNTTRSICDFRLIAFVVMLSVGLAIAAYLLIIETLVPRLEFSLDLVNYEIWSRYSLELGDNSLNQTHVTNVLVTHTGGNGCTEPSSCLSALQTLQRRHMNGSSGKAAAAMPYNFLIGSDGLTYEVRGWDHTSDQSLLLPRNATLLVAFVGNYTHRAPSDEQLRTLHSLLQESVRRRKLHDRYKVFSVRNFTISADDAAELWLALQRVPQFARALHAP